MVQVEEQVGKSFVESVDRFVQKIDTVRRRAAELQQSAAESSLLEDKAFEKHHMQQSDRIIKSSVATQALRMR